MNPLGLILIGAAVYALLQKKGDNQQPKKATQGEPTEVPIGTETEFRPSESVYVDSAKIQWNVRHDRVDRWWATPGFGAGEEYEGPDRVEASTRAALVQAIEDATRKSRAKVLAERRAGELAGMADAEASAKAYADSWTGVDVDAVNVRRVEDASAAWQAGYRTGFEDRLAALGYAVNEDGKITKKGK